MRATRWSRSRWFVNRWRWPHALGGLRAVAATRPLRQHIPFPQAHRNPTQLPRSNDRGSIARHGRHQNALGLGGSCTYAIEPVAPVHHLPHLLGSNVPWNKAFHLWGLARVLDDATACRLRPSDEMCLGFALLATYSSAGAQRYPASCVGVCLRLAGAPRTRHRGAPAVAPNTTNAGSNPNWTTGR